MDEVWSRLAPIAPTAGAILLATIIVFLLRIPQASRTVSESYDRLIAQLHISNDKLREDIVALRLANEECEIRADQLEERVRNLERRRQ